MSNETLHQYLTFNLGKELFALDIGSVREIIDDKDFTTIPRTPNYMRGVINLRGHAVPIVDLRLKFGMSETVLDVNACAIITDIMLGGAMVQIGALADSVQEVIEIRPEEIDPPPKMGTAIDSACIKGMGKRNDGFIIILDEQRFMADMEPESLGLSQGQESEADAPPLNVGQDGGEMATAGGV